MEEQENKQEEHSGVSNSVAEFTEVTITLAEFFAFGYRNQKIYFNQNIEFINEDLKNICNTNKLISISTYSAKLINKQNFSPATYEFDSEKK
jgi:hypothetical protein